MEKIYDMIVIGGGPAGYTAALYAARAGLSTLVLEKLSAGGQMALTEQIDNYPGFEGGIDGFTLGEKMQQSAERFGAVTELAEVYKASLSGRIKTLDTSEGVFQSRTVVIATGASPRPLGIPGEEALVGKGVHYCAACDGAPYRGKTVAVVGGGNSAAADALALSRIAKKVYLIHRRDSLRATKVYHEPLMNAPNVEFCWNSTVSALLHESRLTGLRLQDVNTGAEHDLSCERFFAGNAQGAGRRAGGDDHRAALKDTLTGVQRLDPPGKANLVHLCQLRHRAEALGALLHFFAQRKAVDAAFKAGVVVDLFRQRHLPAGRELFQHQGGKPGTGGVQGGGVSGGAAADDDHIIDLLHSHALTVPAFPG